jgi:hypothetical protein
MDACIMTELSPEKKFPFVSESFGEKQLDIRFVCLNLAPKNLITEHNEQP